MSKLSRFFALALVGCIATAAQAVEFNPFDKSLWAVLSSEDEFDGGQVATSCATIINEGMLSAADTIVGNNTGAVSDFTSAQACGAPCGGYGGTGHDNIYQFTVPTAGNWTFSACSSGLDLSLSLRSTGACPGTACVGGDDDSCAACGGTFSPTFTAALATGTTYYFIVDAFSSADVGPYSIAVTGPGACTSDADCNMDGLFCNGTSTCDLGTGACSPFSGNPCSAPTPTCDEANDACIGCQSPGAPPCDDANFCNGMATCDSGTGLCVAGTPPCLVECGQLCNEATDLCIDPDICWAWMAGPGGTSFFPSGNIDDTPGAGGIQCQAPWVFDDIELEGQSHVLNYYEFAMLARSNVLNASPVGTQYTVETCLFANQNDGTCDPSPAAGLGLMPIAGTCCTTNVDALGNPLTVNPGGTPAQMVRCTAATTPLLPDNSDDDELDDCDIDFYMGYRTLEKGAGYHIAAAGFTAQPIGGPAGDNDFGVSVMWVETCPGGAGVPSGFSGGATFFGNDAGFPADFGVAHVCVSTVGKCCDLGGTSCTITTEADCAGTWTEGGGICDPPTVCDADDDGDGVFADCGDNCPLAPNPGQQNCNGDAEGDACETDPAEQDNDMDGLCNGVDPCPSDPNNGDTDMDGALDCNELCDDDPNKTDPGICGCGVSDADTDMDGALDCNEACDDDPNKTDPGICGCGVSDADSDMDGTVNCNDGCPGDPNKIAAGQCGCGSADTDTDMDGTADCNDGCDNDPLKTAPGNCGCDIAETDPCPLPVPTVSQWGLLILALLLLAAGKVYFNRRRAMA
jgi:hypothetical protein